MEDFKKERLERLLNNQEHIKHLITKSFEWEKYTLFRQNYSHIDRETLEALFSYMMRTLSRNSIPSKQLVDDILKGKEKVPECGYPGCHMGEDHVH